MPELHVLKHSKLPLGEIAVAKRLREIREHYKFSMGELAAECEITKSSMAHYEYGRAPLPLDAGNRICERLDICQNWLARGEAPPRPFLYLSASAADLEKQASTQKLTFFLAYTELLKQPLADAVEDLRSHPKRAESALDTIFTRSSISRLEWHLAKFVSAVRRTSDMREKCVSLLLVVQTANALRQRCQRQLRVDITPSLRDVSAMEISERLQKTRKKHGLTQKEASEKWGVSLKTLQNWEQGERKPRGLALKQLEMILREARQSSD